MRQLTQDEETFCRTLADTLREPGMRQLNQIRRACSLLGVRPLRQAARDALAIIEAGGELTLDGRRWRTPGGVFFRRLKERCTPEQRAAIFGPVPWRGAQQVREVRA